MTREEQKTDKAEWYEQFPGHFYLDIAAEGYDVHVCARGSNSMQPVAIVSLATGKDVFYEQCDSLDEAKEKAERAYREMLESALEEVR